MVKILSILFGLFRKYDLYHYILDFNLCSNSSKLILWVSKNVWPDKIASAYFFFLLLGSLTLQRENKLCEDSFPQHPSSKELYIQSTIKAMHVHWHINEFRVLPILTNRNTLQVQLKITLFYCKIFITVKNQQICKINLSFYSTWYV